MGEVLAGFAGLAVVAALGYLLARWGALPDGADAVLSRLSFYAATPALMIRTLSDADVSEVFSASAAVTVGTAVLLAVVYAVLGRLLTALRGADLTLGALTVSYVNAGNLGIPLLVFAVGDAADIAPILLLQLLVMVPVGFTILDAQTGRTGVSRTQVLTTPLRNPLVLAVALGLLLALLEVEIPRLVMMPVDLLADMAVPVMLVAFGFSLRGAPLPGRSHVRGPMWAAVALRCFGGPAIAYVLASQVFGLTGEALLGPLIVASLPSAQNVFVYAMRYGRAVPMVRDAVLLTTIVCIPVILALVAVLG
ncbi:AEC family transporter [Georgenia halophila]|uniref:AEC family transporter n=1 Tax=Georgenia halophila TaxID=620889 RepID=A0ABP8KZN5_9MICO